MVSLYLHIPFCKQKCLYCDFNSYSGKDKIWKEYFEAVEKEIKTYNILEFNTIYIGGGTPSIVPAEYISKILENLKCNNEITIEMNPGTVSYEKLISYKNIGINRLSIGLQATQNSILKEIGRIHTLEDFDKAYNLARKAGFENINVDLMFGLPNQTLKDVEESLNYLLKKNPEHISCYSLILHSNIFKNLPSDEDERKMYSLIKTTLKEAGYIHYEISNFAKPGKESKHNLCYWNQKEYIGIGAGASSYMNNKRYINELSVEKYCDKINKNEQVFKIEEVQNVEDKLREYIILRLRLLEGVYAKDIKEKFNIDLFQKFKTEINKMEDLGLLENINDEQIKLTEKGLDFANIVWEEFI